MARGKSKKKKTEARLQARKKQKETRAAVMASNTKAFRDGTAYVEISDSSSQASVPSGPGGEGAWPPQNVNFETQRLSQQGSSERLHPNWQPINRPPEEKPKFYAVNRGDTRLWQITERHQALQDRYFGITDQEALVRCMSCGKHGHHPPTCPTRRCAHCKALDQHFTSACPQILKCKRCRKHGHSDSNNSKNCRAPLVPPEGMDDPCDVCGEIGHVEEECSRVWKTFVPSMQNVKKIPYDDMIVACYNCGSDRHWGGDCSRLSLRERTQREGTNRVWTADYAAQFVDMPSGTLNRQQRNYNQRMSGAYAGDDENGLDRERGGYGDSRPSYNYQLAYLNDLT